MQDDSFMGKKTENRIGRYEGVIRELRVDYLGTRSGFRDPEAAVSGKTMIYSV
jgi:hypothetical protein